MSIQTLLQNTQHINNFDELPDELQAELRRQISEDRDRSERATIEQSGGEDE